MWHDVEWHSIRPPVVRHDLTSGYPQLEFPMPAERVYRLVVFTCWTDPSFAIGFDLELRNRRPQDVAFYLCNEPDQAEALTRRGLNAPLISHNSMIDDEFWLLRPAAKEFEAIYVARHNPQKRHELAAAIEGPTLFVGSTLEPWDPPGYTDEIRAACPRAIFHANAAYTPPTEVVDLVNRSRVGLCVSSEEGAMRVTVEYQLCGLPVVACGTMDGRNEFLDPRFSRIVPPDPASVAAAVRDLASRQISGHAIRASVLEKLTAHRRRYIDLVNLIWRGEFVQHDANRKLYTRPPVYKWRRPDEVLSAQTIDVPWQ